MIVLVCVCDSDRLNCGGGAAVIFLFVAVD
jgi:hypothetical protein